jgi:glycosyltransferase involved in cell wall biosynthesis
MKVSVLLPTYRRPILIRRALASLWEQTMNDYELIVIENGGDEEMEKRYDSVRKMVEGKGHKWLCRNDFASLPHALNVGFAESSGQYISVLEDDDEWKPRFLEVLSGHMGYCSCAMAFSKQAEINATGQRGTFGTPIPKHFSAESMLKANFIGFPMAMYRREVIKKMGGFDEKAGAGTDWITHCMASAYGQIHMIDDELVIHHWHGDNYCLHEDQLELTLRQRRLWAEGRFGEEWVRK